MLEQRYPSDEQLHEALMGYARQGALLVPGETTLSQYERLTVALITPTRRLELAAEVLQVVAGLGVVVRLTDAAQLAQAQAKLGAPASTPGSPPASASDEESALDLAAEEAERASLEDNAELDADGEPGRVRGPAVQRGVSVASWPIEKLQMEWHNLPMAERVRVARYGKRPARGLVMKAQDRQLYPHLLRNPGISAEEVAAMAANAAVPPDILQAIAGSPEWQQHSSIVRNLICNPKVTLPQVIRLIDHLPTADIRQLTRSNRVRAAIKREMIRKLERR